MKNNKQFFIIFNKTCLNIYIYIYIYIYITKLLSNYIYIYIYITKLLSNYIYIYIYIYNLIKALFFSVGGAYFLG